jgi:serine protease Do
VLIRNEDGQGSGIIIGHRNKETVILTNRHVIEVGSELRFPEGLEVRNNGRSVAPRRILVAPEGLDLAVIFVEGRLGPSRATSDDAPPIGANVIVVGSPLGSEDSVTTGIVSNLKPTMTTRGFRYNAIQTDAAVNPGNSGGGIFNAETGELIGIISYKLRMTPFESAEGMSFAIPMSVLTKFPYTDWQQVPKENPEALSSLSR